MQEIAIIGVSFEFPGITTQESFWSSLIQQRVCYHNKKSCNEQNTLIEAWGGIKSLYAFDYKFFNYSFKEACYMDPQHRLLLQHSWNALESAGYGNTKNCPSTGVFASASINKYLHGNLLGLMNNDREDEILIGNTHDFLASRIAFKLDLKGPALNIQSGCSSSLVALHQARVALLTKQCDMALVGAVSTSAPNDYGYKYEQGGIRSRNGEIRPFDAESTGTVFTNGVAVIILKELSNAIADNDNILGIVSSSAINNDGANKASFTSPSSLQQAEVIKKAMSIARIKPEQYALIEAHGTGTNLGDPIEFVALQQAFAGVHKKNVCALQSVKANIGHLDTVSGLAGVIKTMLALRNRKIPPQINFTKPNSKINLDDSPFYVNTKVQDIENIENIYAGVTALGIGGTNAHVIMKPFLQTTKKLGQTKNTTPHGETVLLSANTNGTLRDLKLKYLDFLQENNQQLSDIARMSIFSRKEMQYRAAFVVCSTSDLYDQIKSSLNNKSSNLKKDVVFLFPGQGSQYFNMGRDLYDNSKSFRKIVSYYLNIVSNLLNKNCIDIVFNDITNQKQLYDTQNTQPILLALEVALAQYLILCGIQPKALLGHSLGEYSAFVISKVLSFEDAAMLVIKRATLMAETDSGSMLSVMCDFDILQKIKPDNLDIAAVNGHQLTTISGHKSDIESFMKLCSDHDINYHLIQTNKAFHSRLLDNILEKYYQATKSIAFKTPSIPIVSNLDGRILSHKDIADPYYLVHQMRKPVQFVKCIELLQSNYEPIFLEVGPGTTLKSLTQSILFNRENTKYNVCNTLPHPKEKVSSVKTFQQSLSVLWEHNHDINWDKVKNYATNATKIPLPTYPFALERCYASNNCTNPVVKTLNTYTHTWKQLNYSLSNRIDLNKYIIVSLKNKNDIKNLILSLQEQNKSAIIIYKCERDIDNSSVLLKLAQTCLSLDKKNKVVKICFVAYGSTSLQSAVDPVIATLQSQVKVVNQELSSCQCVLIDILESENWWNDIIDELSYDSNYPIIVLRHGTRFVECFEPINLSTNFDKILGNSTLILGGTGNIGLQYAETLLKTTNHKIFLVQRSSTKTIENPTTKREIIKAEKIRSLQTTGKGRIFILSADIGNITQLTDAIQSALEMNCGQPIDNIIHTAGVDASMHYKLLKDIDDEFYQTCFYAKQEGLKNLANIVEQFSIKHCHIVSSISSILGGIGMFVYGGMHSYIDNFVLKQQQQDKVKWSLINWEAWDFQMNDDEPEEFQQGAFGDHLNQLAMSPQFGAKLIETIYGKLFSNFIISNTDLSERYDNWVLGQITRKENINKECDIEKQPRPDMCVEYMTPHNKTQKILANIWSELLGISDIGIYDNFFELGGHSLLALQMLKLINKTFDAKFSIVDLFRLPTIDKIAKSINEEISHNEIRTEANNRFNRKKNYKLISRKKHCREK